MMLTPDGWPTPYARIASPSAPMDQHAGIDVPSRTFRGQPDHPRRSSKKPGFVSVTESGPGNIRATVRLRDGSHLGSAGLSGWELAVPRRGVRRRPPDLGDSRGSTRSPAVTAGCPTRFPGNPERPPKEAGVGRGQRADPARGARLRARGPHRATKRKSGSGREVRRWWRPAVGRAAYGLGNKVGAELLAQPLPSRHMSDRLRRKRNRSPSSRQTSPASSGCGSSWEVATG